MLIEAILIGTLTITSYQPIAAQTKPECTNRNHCRTSIDDGVTQFGIAASQDLLKSGEVHYGDIVIVEGYGARVVNDCMGPRANHAFDLMVFTHAEEKKVGVRHLKVYVVRQKQKSPEEE